jgi:hypothetical protein
MLAMNIFDDTSNLAIVEQNAFAAPEIREYLGHGAAYLSRTHQLTTVVPDRGPAK